MGDGYFQGANVDQRDAEHFGAGWTADELALLHEQWRRVDLTDLALRLGRTEAACYTQYHYQCRRPRHERWQPPEKRMFSAREPSEQERRQAGPVRTIHDDEDRWWEPDFYRERG